MESFVHKVVTVAMEAIVAGVAIGAIFALVRKVQIKLGVGEKAEARPVPFSNLS